MGACLDSTKRPFLLTALPLTSSCKCLARKHTSGYLKIAVITVYWPTVTYGQRPQSRGYLSCERQNARSVCVSAHSNTMHPPKKAKVGLSEHLHSRGLSSTEHLKATDEEEESEDGDQKAAERLISHRKALTRQKPKASAALEQGHGGHDTLTRTRRALPSEDHKRRIAARMRKIHQQAAHRRRISEALTGRKYVCSICGEEGHNKRSCPQAQGSQALDSDLESEAEERSATTKGKTKKVKGVPYSELVALRDRRRSERREEHKDRPKTTYKGLTWHVKPGLSGKGKGTWHVQVWTGKTNKSVGYYEDELEAAREYDKAALQYRGPDAQLNLPEEVKPQPDKREGPFPLPSSSEEEIALAVQTIVAAYESGARRQRIEYLLPGSNDGEAGGVRQEFKVARNLVEATLLRLKDMPAFKGRISVQWLDKSDCVGAWQNEKLAAVVFCTADCLTQLRNLDGGDLGDRLMLVFNPQWQIGGQVLSDFGFGQRRRDAEEFVNSFQDVFFMQQRRVMGDSIRILKCYGAKWQVHYIWPNGRGQLLVSTEDAPPTYQRLLALLQGVPGSKSSRSWVERVLAPEWLPGSSVPVDPELQSKPNSQAYDAQGLSIVRGNGESAAVSQHLASESLEELQDGLADMTSSPVTRPSDKNPVDSPKSLAAAASMDAEALNYLRESPPDQQRDSSPQIQKSAESQSQQRSSGAERFGGREAIRSFQMDPLNNMPQWQKQLLSNSFGHDRGDEERAQKERKVARLLKRKEKLAAEFSRRRKSAKESAQKK